VRWTFDQDEITRLHRSRHDLFDGMLSDTIGDSDSHQSELAARKSRGACGFIARKFGLCVEARGMSNDDDFYRVRMSGLRSLNSCGHCLDLRGIDGRSVMAVVF
jgi:hypothetical protein